MNTCTGLKAIRERLTESGVASIDTMTTYWARHSWATIAASLDIPKETIAAALGHSSHTVTDIYIEFDYRKVDEANRRVLNWVLYGYEGGYAPKNDEMRSEKGLSFGSEKRSDMRSTNRSAWCSK